MTFPPPSAPPIIPADPNKGVMNWDAPLNDKLDAMASAINSAWTNIFDSATAIGLRGITPVQASPTEISNPVDGQVCFVRSSHTYMRYDAGSTAWVSFLSQGADGTFQNSFRGPRVSGVYSSGALVSLSGGTWMATAVTQTGDVPGVASVWAVVASAGTPGASILNGTSNPSSGVGNNGDFYLNTSTNTLFGPKARGAWPGSGVRLVGPAGSTGSTGASGNTILHGTSDPTTQGVNGDFFLNTSTSVLFGPKASGSWPGSGTSLIGPAGAALQPWQFSPEAYGAVGDNVTDDSAAINACITAAHAYAVANNGLYEIVFKSKTYYVGSTPISGGSTYGNALLPIPFQDQTAKKDTAKFTGASRQASGLYHWLQATSPQRAGTVLRTDYNGGGSIPANGEVPGLGGPTTHFAGSPPAAPASGGFVGWSNVLVGIEGLTIEVPANQNVCGGDLRCVAEADVKDLTCLASQTVTGSPPLPTATWGFGLALPVVTNNDRCDIGQYSCEGFTYGLIIYEHLKADVVRLVNCFLGLICWSTSGFPHSNVITYASIENCNKIVVIAGSTGKLDIMLLDIEC